MALTINKIKYHTISEIAEISDVNSKTLRRWINKGDLEHFLFGYKGDKTPLLFRLEPPNESDSFYSKSKKIYKLPKEEKREEKIINKRERLKTK